MNNKYRYEEKLQLVKDYLDGKKIKPEIKGKYRHSLMSKVRMWSNVYLLKGPYALKVTTHHKTWSNKIKLQSIRRILNGESRLQVARSLGMNDTKSLREWYEKYSSLGIIGIESNLKEINAMRPTRYKSDTQLKEENKKLKKQLEYLQAENEYLKKLKALLEKKEQPTK